MDKHRVRRDQAARCQAISSHGQHSHLRIRPLDIDLALRVEADQGSGEKTTTYKHKAEFEAYHNRLDLCRRLVRCAAHLDLTPRVGDVVERDGVRPVSDDVLATIQPRVRI